MSLEEKLIQILNVLRGEDKKRIAILSEENGMEFFPDIDTKVALSGQVIKQFSRARYYNKALEWNDQKVDPALTIIDKRFSGAIAEVAMVSVNTDPNNKDFKCRVFLDGNKIYDDNWDGYSIKHAYLTDMSAFDDGTYYILAFQSLFFNDEVKIEIYESKATFKFVFIKYLVRVDE